MEFAPDRPSPLIAELDEVREQLRLLSFRLVGARAANDQVQARARSQQVHMSSGSADRR